MLIAQMLSLYHCTRYIFKIFVEILNTWSFIPFAENDVISVWVYFLKNGTLDLSLQRFTYVLFPVVT